MRAKGLKLVQMWVYDVNSPEFIAEARRQTLAVASGPQEKEDMEWIESVRISLDDLD